jgi:hypothetical protein
MFEEYLNTKYLKEYLNPIEPIEKMNKYILIVDNNSSTLGFSDIVINCIKDHIGLCNMVGYGKYFTICFTHSYNLQRLNDKLLGLFSNYKANAFNLFAVNTLGWCGQDTQSNLKYYKDFNNA